MLSNDRRPFLRSGLRSGLLLGALCGLLLASCASPTAPRIPSPPDDDPPGGDRGGEQGLTGSGISLYLADHPGSLPG